MRSAEEIDFHKRQQLKLKLSSAGSVGQQGNELGMRTTKGEATKTQKKGPFSWAPGERGLLTNLALKRREEKRRRLGESPSSHPFPSPSLDIER